MAKVLHHGTVIRFICDHLWKEVFRQIELEEGSERTQRLEQAVVPLVPGTSIVMSCSYVERVVFDMRSEVADSGNNLDNCITSVSNLNEIQRYFDLDANWDGWEELGNFFRLRHCFAHELGRVTDRQRPHITNFLRKLENDEIIYEGEHVNPYYEIVDDEIIMKDGWNKRLRIILYHFLKLFEKHGLILEK